MPRENERESVCVSLCLRVRVWVVNDHRQDVDITFYNVWNVEEEEEEHVLSFSFSPSWLELMLHTFTLLFSMLNWAGDVHFKPKQTVPLSLSLSLSLFYTHTYTHTHAHTRTRTHIHTLTLTHSNTQNL